MMNSTSRRILLTTLGAAASALALGCANLDATPLAEARAAVEVARTHPAVDETALDFEEAQRHLRLAEEALDAGRYQESVNHEAFMTKTYAQVAVVQGEASLAVAATTAFLEQAVENADVTRMEVGYARARARVLDALETERGLVLTLGGLNFSLESAELKSEGQLAAARIAGFLIAADNREVLVEGFTDDSGTEAYNLDLSLRRAEAVATALVANGVSPARIAADGFGPAFPVVPNDDKASRAKNRRVEITILDPGRLAAQERRTGGLPGVAAGPE